MVGSLLFSNTGNSLVLNHERFYKEKGLSEWDSMDGKKPKHQTRVKHLTKDKRYHLCITM
ncbi:hypothetical protein RV10_GL004946 [Enterococcus pallens]|nr:hypothetical protein RV10_GL004946 [Enterococcus pallens]